MTSNIGASGTYGKGILARAEEIGVEAVVITRSPHKFKNVKPAITVVELELDEEKKLMAVFYVHKNKRGPMNCSIYDHGDFCLYCVASSGWDKLAPHVSSGPQSKKK